MSNTLTFCYSNEKVLGKVGFCLDAALQKYANNLRTRGAVQARSMDPRGSRAPKDLLGPESAMKIHDKKVTNLTPRESIFIQFTNNSH